MKKQIKKTFEEIYGVDRAKEIKEKAKKTRIKRGCVGIGSTKEKENERRKKISIALKKNPNGGGMRIGSGRGKKGWYKGYWCDSSYELAWVIYHIDHKISFKRNNKGFKYFYAGKIHKFYPDFIKDGFYYEIKGYKTKQLEAKIKQFPHKIKILYKTDLKKIFEYVIDTYGKNFIKLYEDKNYLKFCQECKSVICVKNKSGICRKCFVKKLNSFPRKTKQKPIKKYHCLTCGKSIEKNKTGLCKNCYNLLPRKKKFIISKEELKDLINYYSYEKIGKFFGVSGNTVKKRVKFFDIEIIHEIGYWNKIAGKIIQQEKEKNVKHCNDCKTKLSYKNKSGYCQKCIGKYNKKKIILGTLFKKLDTLPSIT